MLHLAAVDAAREFGGAAGGQDARLLDPILALDAALEVERLADAVDVFGGPVGDLLVGGDLHRIQLLLDQHADAADALEVLRRRRTHHPIVRADAMRGFGTRLRILIGLRAHGPQGAEGHRPCRRRRSAAPAAGGRMAASARSASVGGPRRVGARRAIEGARECGIAAAAQDLRLLDPVLAGDAPAGCELAVEALDVGRRPVRDLRVASDARRRSAPLPPAHRCRGCAASCRRRPGAAAERAWPARAHWSWRLRRRGAVGSGRGGGRQGRDVLRCCGSDDRRGGWRARRDGPREGCSLRYPGWVDDAEDAGAETAGGCARRGALGAGGAAAIAPAP